MTRGLNTNRTLGGFFTVIFIAILIAFLSEIQKPNSREVDYITSYFFFEKITLNQLVTLKAFIISLTIIFPVSIGLSRVLRGRVQETPDWLFIALFALLIAGIYLTFLI